MSKRRVFDIDYPTFTETGPVPEHARPAAPEESRRSPMASAIGENAEALRNRAEAERRIREENDQLAHEHVRLKKAGLITDLVEIDSIRTSKLTRDRKPVADPDLDELKNSIRAVGLSNPIRVEPVGDGSYELVQGFRRLTAYRALAAEEGGERFARIPATIMAQGETLEQLYRKMVDENLVRRDVSFAEMAQLALAYVEDPETDCDDLDQSVSLLYASASRQKRSYIRRFATLLEVAGPALNFPEEIPRALGLELEKRMAEDMSFGPDMRDYLEMNPARTGEEEVQTLRTVLTLERRARATRPAAKPASSAKTTLRCDLPEGQVRIAARRGKVELSMDRDFSEFDPARLEAATAAFMQALKG